ncbi:MAG TPA: hypothetical protein PLZ75_11290, partial [Bacteroidales bacterium]|nr:hypothetical protein [Bacteroidales bacterium]
MKKNKFPGKTFFSIPKKLFPILRTVVFLIISGTLQVNATDTYLQNTGIAPDLSDAVLIIDPGSDAPEPGILQQQTISGTVTDIHTREPMPGVNIVEKGTTTGTITDLGG